MLFTYYRIIRNLQPMGMQFLEEIFRNLSLFLFEVLFKDTHNK